MNYSTFVLCSRERVKNALFSHVTLPCQALQCTLAQAAWLKHDTLVSAQMRQDFEPVGLEWTYFRVASHLVCSVVSEPATFAQTLPLFTGDGQTVLGSELPSMRSWPPTTIILTVTKNNKNTYVIMSSSHPHSMTNMTQRCCSPTWLSKQLCCPNHVASSFASIPSPPTKRTISNSFHLSSTVSASFHAKIAFRRQGIQNCFENYRHPTHPQDSSNQNYLKHVARIQLNLNAAYCQASLG